MHGAARPHKRLKAETLPEALRASADIFEALIALRDHCQRPEACPCDVARALEEYLESRPSIGTKPSRALDVATLVLSETGGETDRVTPLAFACVLGLPAPLIWIMQQYRSNAREARHGTVVREDELWPPEDAPVDRMLADLRRMPRGTRDAR